MTSALLLLFLIFVVSSEQKIGTQYRECDPIEYDEAYNEAKCRPLSCRKYLGCGMDGKCIFDVNNDSEGRVERCCRVASDCPTYSHPAYWNESLATEYQKACQTVSCDDRRGGGCKYSSQNNCCYKGSGKDGHGDCKALSYKPSKCSKGACIKNRHIDKAAEINNLVGTPYISGRRHVYENMTMQYKALGSISPSSSSDVAHNYCETRIRSDCECESDSDCKVPYLLPCSSYYCDKSEKRCRVADFNQNLYKCCGKPDTKQEMEQQCSQHVQKNGDACLVPLGCDSEPEGPFLPTHNCKYVRRVSTANCCTFKGDCEALSSVNECVRNECTPSEKKCALDFENPKCCYTSKDCYTGNGMHEVFKRNGTACSVLQCTGDSQLVEDEKKHHCVPLIIENCPMAAERIEKTQKPEPVVEFEFSSCDRATILHVALLLEKMTIVDGLDIPLNNYPVEVEFFMYFINQTATSTRSRNLHKADGEFVLASELLDDVSIAEFTPVLTNEKDGFFESRFELHESTKEELFQSLKGLHLHFKVFLDTQLLAASGLTKLFEDEKISIRLKWTDGSENQIDIDTHVINTDILKC